MVCRCPAGSRHLSTNKLHVCVHLQELIINETNEDSKCIWTATLGVTAHQPHATDRSNVTLAHWRTGGDYPTEG